MPDTAKEKILSLLAKEWELKGPPEVLDVDDVVSILSLAPSDSMETIRELFLSGLVDMNTFKTRVFLTPEG
jgi:hypothetical protein